MSPIRLVTFDALYTLITLRYPVHVQYSQVFAPYVGVLQPEAIQMSFKEAWKVIEREDSSNPRGSEEKWRDIIRRTALGAGANQQALDVSLSEILPRLMERFSSKEGYKAFDDAIPTIHRLNDELGVRTAVISNGDFRIRSALTSLGFPDTLNSIILSDVEGVEKPSPEIFMKALDAVNATISPKKYIQPAECLHVGDELVCDYKGATGAGFEALLLRRHGVEGERAHRGQDEDEDLIGVPVIHNLDAVVDVVRERPS
ncbi:unnamed protein product [Cyclocybe aegerita]|uniref:Haloacid dehalogenase-like hydrolase domain-containing protein 3 n=1 Tax=Cyclocybe aegerita TaxID=1973307 RepID=A0A8S0XTI2_CYCAE|nr:unnamed protein product [Cyclocybe aegerita]